MQKTDYYSNEVFLMSNIEFILLVKIDDRTIFKMHMVFFNIQLQIIHIGQPTVKMLID